MGFDAAAQLAVSGLAGEGSRVQLVDAVGADLIRSVDQPLAEFALEQHALPGRDARVDGGVIVWSDGPVERSFDTEPVGRGRGVARHQKSGLALYGRIGC